MTKKEEVKTETKEETKEIDVVYMHNVKITSPFDIKGNRIYPIGLYDAIIENNYAIVSKNGIEHFRVNKNDIYKND